MQHCIGTEKIPFSSWWITLVTQPNCIFVERALKTTHRMWYCHLSRITKLCENAPRERFEIPLFVVLAGVRLQRFLEHTRMPLTSFFRWPPLNCLKRNLWLCRTNFIGHMIFPPDYFRILQIQKCFFQKLSILGSRWIQQYPKCGPRCSSFWDSASAGAI